MSLMTLRQLQKMFSRAARLGGNSVPRESANGRESEVAALATFVTEGKGRFIECGVNSHGGIVNLCRCPECTKSPKVDGVRSMVDRWVREYGPDTSIEDLIRDELAKKQAQQQQQAQQPGQPGNQQGQPQQGQQQGQQQSGQSSGDGQNGQQRSQQQQPSNQTQTTGPASDSVAEPPPQQPQPQPRAKPAPTPEQRELAAAKEALKDAKTAAAKGEGGKPATKERIAVAKKKLKRARKKASFNAAAEANGASLMARKSIAQANGRLQRVPQNLRNRMADLINRLVEQGGTAGESLSPIPMLSATKLVKRMVVRRPLANALKEDTIAGRPVVLFLPDVSPSCRAQAQVACDLANAAGYVGVSGSDVLVLPHSNGHVDSEEEYIPWFNGKPMSTDVREVSRTFHEICEGRSRYRVRVVVFLGDHDAVERYGKIANLRSVTRVLWLHNRPTRSGYPEPAAASVLPRWSPEAMAKLSMLVGCVDQPRMLTGFDMALKMQK